MKKLAFIKSSLIVAGLSFGALMVGCESNQDTTSSNPKSSGKMEPRSNDKGMYSDDKGMYNDKSRDQNKMNQNQTGYRDNSNDDDMDNAMDEDNDLRDNSMQKQWPNKNIQMQRQNRNY